MEFKERYLRPNYLQLSFGLGFLTIGMRVAGANYAFTSTVSSVSSVHFSSKVYRQLLVIQRRALSQQRWTCCNDDC